jgi:hypothetical protein
MRRNLVKIMHDPLTVAFNVKIPLPWKTTTFWKDKRKEWASYQIATIWHKDPEKDHTDDSCGWFKRARHGDKAVLEKIVKRFEFDWDRVFKSDSGKVYHCGYFYPEDDGAGMPNMGVSAIVLNLFFMAAGEYFESTGQTNWKKARRWMQNNLFDILMFAENPTDSLRDGVVRKWGTESNRDERIRNMASEIYGWILRREQCWWRHPRWHIHHWRIQVPFFQLLNRWLFVRCSKCKGRFKWKESVCGSWSGNDIWHERCQSEIQKPSEQP